MLGPQSFSSSQSAFLYQPGWNGTGNAANVEEALMGLDLGNGRTVSSDRVGAYVRVALGVSNECNDTVFEQVAQNSHLESGTSFLAVTADRADLAVGVFARVDSTRAFPDGHSLDQDAFFGFVEHHTGIDAGVLRAHIPAGLLDAISMLKAEDRPDTSGEETTKVRVQLNRTEFRMEVETPSGFSLLPAELVESIGQYLPSAKDRAQMAMTNRSTHAALFLACGQEKLVHRASGVRSLDDVKTWVEVGGSRHADFQTLPREAESRVLSALASGIRRIDDHAQRMEAFHLVLAFTSRYLDQSQWAAPLLSLIDVIGSFEYTRAEKAQYTLLETVKNAERLTGDARMAVFTALASALWLHARGEAMFDRIRVAVDSQCPGQRDRFIALSLHRLGTNPQLRHEDSFLVYAMGKLLRVMFAQGSDTRAALSLASLCGAGIGDEPPFTFDRLMELMTGTSAHSLINLWEALETALARLSPNEVPVVADQLIMYLSRRANESCLERREAPLIDMLINLSETWIRMLPLEEIPAVFEEMLKLAVTPIQHPYEKYEDLRRLKTVAVSLLSTMPGEAPQSIREIQERIDELIKANEPDWV